jgi:enoyl-CoA hydratase/carnithine racemase
MSERREPEGAKVVDIDTGTGKMLARVDDGIGWMTYNNPARHNAMSMEMQRAVPRILAAFRDDPAVRVVVITGAGDRAFVSGADISEFGEQRTSVEAREHYDAAMAEGWRAWGTLDKPVLAMIRGYCIGGGLLTALRADIRLAADGSQFGVPAARLGLGYAFGGVEELVSLVGPSWASEILFSARRLTADEALRIGLVNRVVAPARLEPEVRALASAIAANAPLTVRACKVAIREATRPPSERNRAHVDELVEACFRSEDYLEGQAAFAEKREPRFRGR